MAAAIRDPRLRLGPMRLTKLIPPSLVLVGVCGCLSGSLATSTGPRYGGQWSVARLHPVHVGETVRFSFLLKEPLAREALSAKGVADYSVFDFGGERVQADIEKDGRFLAQYTFDDVVPGQTIVVEAIAFRQHGPRDQVKINDTWVQNLSPNNEKDEPVAGASAKLVVYQAQVRMALPPSANDFDFSTGQLLLRREGAAGRPVFEDRPHRRGFLVTDRNDGAGWWVTYSPSGNEINPVGVTEVEFSVYDQAGNRRVFRDLVDTP